MNKFKYLIIIISVVSFSSCLKDTPFLDLSNTQPIAEFSRGTTALALSSWGVLADTTEIDTAIAVDIASPQVLNYDVTFNIKFDPTLITKWNAANPNNQLQMLPDSCFSLPSTSVKVAAGYRYGKIPVKLYPQKIDPTVSYVMPFEIASTTQSGQALTISNNAGVIMYAFIGNPIAGSYEQYWTRWNSADTSGGSSTAAAYNTDEGTVTFSPNSPTEIQVTSSGTGETDIIDFTNTGGVLSDFTVSFPSNTLTTLGLNSIGPAKFMTVDPIHGIYQIYFPYVNGSGAARTIINTYIKQ